MALTRWFGRRNLALPASTWYLIAVLAATLLGAILRFHKLADANLWEDEARTAWFQRLDVPTMLFATASDTQPPLSYLLFHLWRLPAGSTAYALRFLAALLGVLTVPACAGLGRRLGGPSAGAIAALLIAIARFHVWWSQQIRMYSLVTLLGTISLYCFLTAMQHRSVSAGSGPAAAPIGLSGRKSFARLQLRLHRPAWLLIGMAVANLANLYTLYFSVMLILLESLFVLIVLIRQWRWWLFGWWTGLQLASIALFLPWLLYFKQHAITFGPRTLPRPNVSAFIEGSWSELSLGIDTYVNRLRAINIALALLFVGLLLWLTLRSRRRASAWWLALIVIAIPVSAYLITLPAGLFFSPTYQTRYQLPALPALLALAAWGIATLPRWWRAGPLALLVATSAWSLAAYYPTRHLVDDYQSLSRFIQAYERPGDIIVIDPDSDAELFLFAYHGQLPWAGLPANLPLTEAQAGTYFDRWLHNHSAIWLVQIAAGHDAGPTHPVQRWLAGHLRQNLTMASGNKLVALYQASSAPPRTLNSTLPPQFPLHGIPGIAGYDQPLWDVRPGDILHLAVYGPATPGATIAVGGNPALSGRSLPGQADFDVAISPLLPSGRAQLMVTLADGRHVALGSVSIEPHAIPPAPQPVPPLAHLVNRDLGGQALLVSYTVAPQQPAPGQTFAVTLQWRALQAFAANETVFVHLLDARNQVVAQHDGAPANGAQPTVEWTPGETILDAHALPLPKSLAAGTYTLEVGMYLQSTGQRLQLQGNPAQDRILLGRVRVP